MSHIANPFVVILDANVLYPFRVRDVLLNFAFKGLFRARWTNQIIAEWTENLIKNRPELEASVRSQENTIRSAFEGCWIHGYESLIDALCLPDANDRHVLAAAIKCSAQHIVTENLKDFPPSDLEKYGVEAIKADDFLTHTFELFTFDAMGILRDLRKSYDNPPFSPSEFLNDLAAKGLPKLAANARAHIEFL